MALRHYVKNDPEIIAGIADIVVKVVAASKPVAKPSAWSLVRKFFREGM